MGFIVQCNKRDNVTGLFRNSKLAMGGAMTERLPPLNALKAFEAAARHASFRKAARELNVSPAAISHQIKNLEATLGVQLFHRLSRALRLSAAGQAALPLLRDGFGRLAAAVQQLREEDGRRPALRVWAPPSFAAKWLVPRLSRFAAQHPGIDIRLSATPALIGADPGPAGANGGFRPEDADLAIRFGEGDWAGVQVEKLMAVWALPLCSPRLLASRRPLRRPDDLRHHTLLHDDTDYAGRPEWRAWLAAARVDAIDSARGPRFNQAALAIEAAAEGQGVALSLQPLARGDIAAGRLAAPFAVRMRLRPAYYLVCAEGAPEEPATAAFRRWLLAEAEAEAEAEA
jgi:LysR family transcriptional regulator, glycine cleavage system transcriptional activator